MRIVYGLGLLVALAGCGTLDGLGATSHDTVAAIPFADQACGAVARQRAEDAALNGFADLQVQVAHEAYAGCMVLKQKFSQLASAAP